MKTRLWAMDSGLRKFTTTNLSPIACFVGENYDT